MQTTRLGESDLNLTKIGLGTWAIGGPEWEYGWGQQDKNKSIDAILCGIENGINWIDTAPAYGLGESEKVIAEALKKLNKKPVIATKCGLVSDSKRKISSCLKKESIRREVEDSLRRLEVDVIDLCQIHWPRPDADIEEGWEELVKLKSEGKIRWLGVSNFSVSQLKRVMNISKPVSLQPPFSMIERSIENVVLDFCAENNIGVIVYSPMQKGLLTGKFTKEKIEQLPANDHRKNDSNFREPRLSKNIELVENLKDIASKLGITLSQLAIAWVLSNPKVTSAIVGVRNVTQVNDIITAHKIKLSPDVLEQIRRLL